MKAARRPQSEAKSIRQWSWKNIIFFLITTGIGVIGTPLYLMHHELTGVVSFLFLFYIIASAMSITVGYHRLMAHRTFKAHPVIEFLLLFFGAASFEQSALKWASQHRDHHQFVDTDRDPYSIKKGFWYAHIGWLIFWTHPKNYGNVKDLQKNKLIAHQHQYYLLWAAGAGFIVPLMIGAFTGQLLGVLIISICLRLTVVYHSTFCINSVCHMFGKTTYDLQITAKDHWFVALLTFGEGYHNFHHRFPSDYRNAVRWYQWDPSKWMIFLLNKVGLTRDLRRVSDFRILEAKIAAQKEKTYDWITLRVGGHQLQEMCGKLDHCYAEMKQTLFQWEAAARQCRAAVSEYLGASQANLRKAAFLKLEIAENKFREAQKKWEDFRSFQLAVA